MIRRVPVEGIRTRIAGRGRLRPGLPTANILAGG